MKECEHAFREIKEKLTSDLFLTHFDPNLDIIVASDASTHDVGACILHKWKDGKVRPIAHASRSLLPAERNYSQIEKEALAIIFAVIKFNTNEKVFCKNYKNNTTTWEPGTIKERIGNMIYTVQGKKFIHRRHINQLQKQLQKQLQSPMNQQKPHKSRRTITRSLWYLRPPNAISWTWKTAKLFQHLQFWKLYKSKISP